MSAPFLWINHGTPDLESVDKCAEVFLWFARPVAESERANIMEGCPEPVSHVWGWGDSFCYFGSRGDSYDATVLWKYAPRALVEASDKAVASKNPSKIREATTKLFDAMPAAIDGFVADLERWVTRAHNIVPIALFWGVPGTPDDDPWTQESVARFSDVMSERIASYKPNAKGERELFGWIKNRCAPLIVAKKTATKPTRKSAVDDALIATLDDVAARCLPRKYVSRLSYEEGAIHEAGALTNDYVFDGTDVEARMQSLAPATQLVYLASYTAEKNRAIERFKDPTEYVRALCERVPEAQQRAVVPLLVMMASSILHDTPAFDRIVKARLLRATKLVQLALPHPRCRAGTFARAARYLRWLSRPNDALRTVRDGIARFGERPVLLRALARAERAVAARAR
ncbi:MAG: hypothetical protein U0269_24975 [Polyangiales bacterium]